MKESDYSLLLLLPFALACGDRGRQGEGGRWYPSWRDGSRDPNGGPPPTAAELQNHAEWKVLQRQLRLQCLAGEPLDVESAQRNRKCEDGIPYFANWLNRECQSGRMAPRYWGYWIECYYYLGSEPEDIDTEEQQILNWTWVPDE